MRDKQTDQLLLRLRTLYNGSLWDDLEQHRLLMSDWLEERGRPEEAAALRGKRWLLITVEGQGWPPPCFIKTAYVSGQSWAIYLDSDWITSAVEEERYHRENPGRVDDQDEYAWTERW